MRIWNVNPKLMCNQHLLGEHVELHMFVGSINKGRSVDGHVNKEQLQTNIISSRHEELSSELKSRGFNHKSPLHYIDKLNKGYVERDKMLSELSKRCLKCRKLIEESLK